MKWDKERYHTDPNYRERWLAQNRERYHSDPNYRERLLARKRERYHQNPEFRARARAKERARYRANRVRERERMKAYRDANRDMLNEIKRCQTCSYMRWWLDAKESLGFGKCCVCGSTEFVHCHHVDRKSFNLADLYKLCPTPERLDSYISELKKCIPLCQNCHSDIHSNSEKRQVRVIAGLIEFILRETVNA